MTSRWHQKKAKQAEEAFERALQGTKDLSVDANLLVKDSAMGGGDDELFEKKLSKEEKYKEMAESCKKRRFKRAFYGQFWSLFAVLRRAEPDSAVNGHWQGQVVAVTET